MSVDLRACDKAGLSLLFAIGAANAMVWMCVMAFPLTVEAQRSRDISIESNMQSQIDEIEERQIESRISVSVMTEKMISLERSQAEITEKLDTVITGIIALFGTVLSGCVVAYFSLKVGWVSAKT